MNALARVAAVAASLGSAAAVAVAEPLPVHHTTSRWPNKLPINSDCASF